MIAINALGPVLAMQRVASRMGAGGSIVNICSLAALTGHYTAAYTASKWAPSRFIEGCQHGIRRARHPRERGVPRLHRDPDDCLGAGGVPQRHRNAAPMGRAGAPREVAELCVWLLSDQASYVNGAEIAIDGGTWAHGGAKFLSDALRPAVA